MADFSTLYTVTAPVQVLAQAYGTSSYSSNTYNGSSATAPAPQSPTPQTPVTTGSTAGAPNTGFAPVQPLLTIPLPVLFAAALIVGTISFVISRAIRRRKQR